MASVVHCDRLKTKYKNIFKNRLADRQRPVGDIFPGIIACMMGVVGDTTSCACRIEYFAIVETCLLSYLK